MIKKLVAYLRGAAFLTNLHLTKMFAKRASHLASDEDKIPMRKKNDRGNANKFPIIILSLLLNLFISLTEI